MHLPGPAGSFTSGVLGRRDSSKRGIPRAHGFQFHGHLLAKLAALIADKFARRTRPTDPAIAKPLPNGAGMLGWARSDDLKPGCQIQTIYELVLQPLYVAKDKEIKCHTFAKLASTSELGREMCGIYGLL